MSSRKRRDRGTDGVTGELVGPFLGIVEFHEEEAPAAETPIARALRFLAHCIRSAQSRENMLMQLCRFDESSRRAVALELDFAEGTLVNVARYVDTCPPSAGTLDLLRRMLAMIDTQGRGVSVHRPQDVKSAIAACLKEHRVTATIVANACWRAWDCGPDGISPADQPLINQEIAAISRACTSGRRGSILEKLSAKPRIIVRLAESFRQRVLHRLEAQA